MRERPVRAAVAAVVAVLSLTAAVCERTSAAEQQPSPVASAPGSAERSASDALLSITPREGRKRAEPGAGISVTVSGGTITSVTAMAIASGDPLEGRLRGGTAWHSMWALEHEHEHCHREQKGEPLIERRLFVESVVPSLTRDPPIS